MTTAFSDLNLHPQLLQAVSESGYTEPTPIQTAVIPLILAGQDVIGQAQTGTGKTAAFALPILNNLEPGHDRVQCLVITPTRELALQVANAMGAYGAHSQVRVLAVYGGQAYGRQIGALQRGVDIVVGTPGRLLDLLKRAALDLSALRFLILDEADEMLSMGFIEDIEAILEQTPETRQTALFSATLPPPIQRLAQKYLHAPQAVAITPTRLTVEAIAQRYYLVNPNDKLAALTRLFEIEPIHSALIFVRTRAASGELANELSLRGFPSEVLNGDLAQETREGVLRRFRQNQIKVLVATDVAARGLDIEDISHVFNFDLPEDPEVYVHRIGRTGRAGKSGIAISLVTPAERWRLQRVEKLTRQKIARAALPTEADIRTQRDTQLLDQMAVWLKRSRYQHEKELVAGLVAEGHDPLEIAAAALKIARAEEKQRPIAPLSEVHEPEYRRNQGQRGPALGRQSPASQAGRRRRSETAPGSHEAGMVRVTISKGRRHGVRPADVVSTIAYHADIPGNTLGKILIEEQHTLVDVPERFLAQVLSHAASFRIRRQPVDVRVSA